MSSLRVWVAMPAEKVSTSSLFSISMNDPAIVARVYVSESGNVIVGEFSIPNGNRPTVLLFAGLFLCEIDTLLSIVLEFDVDQFFDIIS
jgi:hypothetical protein